MLATVSRALLLIELVAAPLPAEVVRPSRSHSRAEIVERADLRHSSIPPFTRKPQSIAAGPEV